MTATAVLAASSAISPVAGQPRPQHTFVLVHGAWHGGWCWRDLASELRNQGHRVTTPTLTGLGERTHLLSSSVDLETHISDIVSHIDSEELNDVILVGHSYGGFPVRAAAALRADKIAHVVYLDAFVPLDGEMVASYVPADRLATWKDALANNPVSTLPPLTPDAFGITAPEQRAWVERHLTPHPLRTYLQPLATAAEGDNHTSQHYIACMSPKLDVFDSTRERISQDKNFSFTKLNAGHDVMVSEPALLARTLLSYLG
ncbi:alpha/beta hydrolase [Bradyrhizobium sp. CIAT3101]|uniref:alpha/beta hydrolase family protein n=1 Tax=Bradyrhizobium sp. CIAT3101 TaxID=439387 RepID=UPI0024B064AD|nr:alpha/beta hydrolase family protein [Bradyrhizobium sp. CIAT3101]WFU78197.1 alpha/beta hydrolase [Bradyrhizobium sp. CIAT3101]